MIERYIDSIIIMGYISVVFLVAVATGLALQALSVL